MWRRLVGVVWVFSSVVLAALAAARGEQADFWKANGKHGAVVAGRAEAADAGPPDVIAWQRGGCGRLSPPGALGDRRAELLLRRRSADHGLRRQEKCGRGP